MPIAGAGLSLSSKSTELLARSIDRTGSQSGIVFLCDTTVRPMRLTRLYQQGLAAEAVDVYSRSRVYTHDPFLIRPITQSRRAGSFIVLDSLDRDLRRDQRSRDYWAFLSHFRICVTGAVIKPISSKTMLVGRLYRDSKRPEGSIAPVADDMGLMLDLVASQMMATAAQTITAELTEERLSRNLIARLSPRRRSIVDLVRSGMLNKEIAYALRLPEHTVENDLRQVYRHFGVRNRAALVEHLPNRPRS